MDNPIVRDPIRPIFGIAAENHEMYHPVDFKPNRIISEKRYSQLHFLNGIFPCSTSQFSIRYKILNSNPIGVIFCKAIHTVGPHVRAKFQENILKKQLSYGT